MDTSPHRETPAALGGAVLTPSVVVLLALAAVGFALIGWRMFVGLGAATALNDGYPWGLWIAFDVVTGTAFGCGGFAVALLVYLANNGRYHPLVRPALLTSALGYTVAALSVLIDLGRPWLVWKVPLFFWEWNGDSVLLEVALCITAYCMILWIELLPFFLEKACHAPQAWLRDLAVRALPPIRRSMVWVIAAGMLLPIMHQSSLGALLLLAGPRLHGFWNTPLLPLLFLISCISMGFGAVVLESSLSSRLTGRSSEKEMLAGIGKVMLPTLGLFMVVRAVDLAARGELGALAAFDVYAVMLVLEFALFTTAMALLRNDSHRHDAGNLFRAAMVLMTAGTLYRFDVYLLAFNPGPHFFYFPSTVEILISTGLVAAEVAAFVIAVRIFPILTGPAIASQEHHGRA